MVRVLARAHAEQVPALCADAGRRFEKKKEYRAHSLLSARHEVDELIEELYQRHDAICISAGTQRRSRYISDVSCFCSYGVLPSVH